MTTPYTGVVCPGPRDHVLNRKLHGYESISIHVYQDVQKVFDIHACCLSCSLLRVHISISAEVVVCRKAILYSVNITKHNRSII